VRSSQNKLRLPNTKAAARGLLPFLHTELARKKTPGGRVSGPRAVAVGAVVEDFVAALQPLTQRVHGTGLQRQFAAIDALDGEPVDFVWHAKGLRIVVGERRGWVIKTGANRTLH